MNRKKVAIYIRVSTLYQIDKFSLPLQRDELENYCKYALGINNFVIFEDAGYSAKNTDRPAFQEMMNRVRAKEFTHILVWKLDRISRNLLDFASMYAEMKRLNVTFISKNEQFDTSTAMGEAMLKIILVFAELERNMTSERVTATMISRASNGQWNGGKIPYGYDYDKQTKIISINEREAKQVRTLYDRYEASQSLIQMTKELNEAMIPTKNGRNWSPTTLHKILTNVFYTGTYRYNYLNEKKGFTKESVNKEEDWVIIEDHHVPIITKEQFDRVQLLLQSKSRSVARNQTRTRSNVHIFAGLINCGGCGSQMAASRDRARADGYRPSIYLCSQRRLYHNCENKYISDIVAGDFVFNYIANLTKAQKSFGRTTSIETLQKKLLRGVAFADVTGIERHGLEETYDMLRAGINEQVLYNHTESKPIQDTNSERDLLMSEKRKTERALQRLRNLYLYEENEGLAISEKDFLVEQKKLIDTLAKVDERLSIIERTSVKFYISDEDFISKASFFILSRQLADSRYINFGRLARTVDANVLKEFVNSIIQNFCVLDGKIISLQFKNGIEHKFLRT